MFHPASIVILMSLCATAATFVFFEALPKLHTHLWIAANKQNAKTKCRNGSNTGTNAAARYHCNHGMIQSLSSSIFLELPPSVVALMFAP